jgi:F-box-like
MQLKEIEDEESHWRLEGNVPKQIRMLTFIPVTSAPTTVDALPNEVIFNIFEKLQEVDRNRDLYHCLFVSKRWSNLALPLIWQEFEFHLAHPNQIRLIDRFLENPECRAHLQFVRSLSLYISLRGDRVLSYQRCCDICDSVEQFVKLLSACTGLQSLRLKLQTFVESSCHPLFWDRLETANASIKELVRVASLQKYSQLSLHIDQPLWSMEDGVSEISAEYVEALGPQTTRLHLSENASQAWQWLKSSPRIRSLRFDNTASDAEAALTPFWGAIKELPLEELTLSRVTFPPKTRRFPNWHNLRRITLNQFNDVEGTCATILSSFPNLFAVSLNNPLNFQPPATTTPIPQIVCTNLRVVVFTQCRTQKSLTAAIAKVCPNIRVFMPPTNANDADIITLIDHCPFLDTLSIDYCHNLTSVSFHYIPRANRLRSFKFHVDHFMYFDEECIFALASSCPDLHSRGCRIQPGSSLGEKNEKSQRMIVRERLRGSASFKRWVLRFIGWIPEGPALHFITFDIDQMRAEMVDFEEQISIV